MLVAVIASSAVSDERGDRRFCRRSPSSPWWGSSWPPSSVGGPVARRSSSACRRWRRARGGRPRGEADGVEPALHHLELVTDRAAEAVAESSADAIRLRRALDTLPQGVIVCDENGEVVFRNARAVGLMGGRHGDALAAAGRRRPARRCLEAGLGPAHARPLRPAAPHVGGAHPAHRRRPAHARRDRRHRRRVRAAAAGGDPARLRGQRQPRAEDADGGARAAGGDARGRDRTRRWPSGSPAASTPRPSG